MQIDNCNFEESQIVVDHPGTCHFRYCSLYRVQMVLNHVNSSLIENCDFKQCTVHVQGFPKESRNWTCEPLSRLINIWDAKVGRCNASGSKYTPLSAADLERGFGAHDSFQTSSAFEVNKSEVDSIGVASIDCLSDQSENSPRKSDDDWRSKSTSDASRQSFYSFSSLSDNGSNHELHETVQQQQLNITTEPGGSDLQPAGDDSGGAGDHHQHEPVTSRAISISSKSKLTANNLPPLEELEHQSLDSTDCSSYTSTSPSLLEHTGTRTGQVYVNCLVSLPLFC